MIYNDSASGIRITCLSPGRVILREVNHLADKEKKIKENVNAELSGMGLYGTTSNTDIEGYSMSGDIENAGHPEKGFEKAKKDMGAKASLKDSP